MTAPEKPFTPVALAYARHDISLGFLVLPHDTLFTCEGTQNGWPWRCVICAASQEQALGLIQEYKRELNFTPQSLETNEDNLPMKTGEPSIEQQLNNIVPFSLAHVMGYFDNNRHLSTAILTATTEHNGESAQHSTLVKPMTQCILANNPYLEFEVNAKHCLFSNLQQVLFQTLIENYRQSSEQRRPRFYPAAPIGVDELLMPNAHNWYDYYRNPMPTRYAIADGDLNFGRCPIRIAQVIKYPLQHGTIKATSDFSKN